VVLQYLIGKFSIFLREFSTKNPGPVDPALTSPQRVGFYFKFRLEFWNFADPPEEEWNHGTLGSESG